MQFITIEIYPGIGCIARLNGDPDWSVEAKTTDKAIARLKALYPTIADDAPVQRH